MLSRFRSTILAALVPLLACAGGAGDGVDAPRVALATVDVAVTPANLLMATGATTSFAATVTGSADTTVTWTVQEGDAGGTIDGSGSYVAPATAGVYHVVATSKADPSRSGTAVVTVEASATAPATDITIAPTAVVVPAGSQQSFTCSGSSTACSFSVVEGSAGGTIDSTGLYVAPLSTGTYHVVASNRGGSKKASAVVVVTAQAQAVAVAISPTSVAIQIGTTQAFQCTVTGSADTACAWSIQEGSAGGSIDAAGSYTAPASPGTYHVIASSHADPTKSAAATVTVAPAPPPGTVSITPTSVAILTRGTQSFVCTVGGATDGACTWSVQEGAAGGSIAASGSYTAPATPGTYHVVAASQADPTKTATATVSVSAPVTPISVVVGPTSASVSACQSLTLAATVSGTTNQAVTWSIQEGAGGGTISAQGVYTAPSTAGTFHAVATSSADPAKSASTTIVVAEKVVSIAVTPSTVTVQPGQTVQFTANVTTTCGTFQSSTVAGS